MRFVAGLVTAALVTSNTVLVSRLSPSAVAFSFAIAFTWTYSVSAVKDSTTTGRLVYAAGSASGCLLTILALS